MDRGNKCRQQETCKGTLQIAVWLEQRAQLVDSSAGQLALSAQLLQLASGLGEERSNARLAACAQELRAAACTGASAFLKFRISLH